MATYFIDPYTKYYDALKGAQIIASESEAMASKVSDSMSSVDRLSSIVSTSDWKEKGATELTSTTISNLKGCIQTIENNITNSLKAACDIAINSLLPELEGLKTEDETYDAVTTELNNLVVPMQYDDEGYITSAYLEYKDTKSRLTSEQNRAKTKCIEHQTNARTYADQVKAKDGALEEIKQKVSTGGGGTGTLTVLDYDANSNLIKVSYNGQEFYVVNTKTSVIEYEEYVQKNKCTQNGGILGGECMLLSQYYAVDLLRGTFTSRDDMAQAKGSPATRINDYVSSPDEDDVLEYIYTEALAGRPTVLQVTQVRSDEGLRHLVTVVGFDSSVKSYKDLTPDNILVLDCVDGKIQTLGQARAEGGHARSLFAQGGKYFARGATDGFLSKEVYTTKNA